MRFTSLTRARALGAALLLAAIASTAGFAGPAAAAGPVAHTEIDGTGSSWSGAAVNIWISQSTSQGLKVVFTPNGSAQGRKDFANGTTDFGVTDIGYQGKDSKDGSDDTNCIPGQPCRGYAYEPVVAGGTAFPYQLKVAGKRITNLRLSGETIAKIFTNKITNWDDPEISTDNNGRKLPSLSIIPVTHTEGSGSTAQFTTYLDTMYPSIWRPFFGQSGFTEYFPTPSGGHAIQQSGSDGVMNFIASDAANGAIGYDEYAYAKARGYPVAKLENAKGYFTLPDKYNVAVALTHAKINMDKSSPNYLLQTLNNVYTAPEPQAYAMSSYSYFLIPTGKTDPRMTTAKRQTLADFLYYAVCKGQTPISDIGYSPLPINLVQASFAQTARLHDADSGVVLTGRAVNTCNNPTFVAGHPEINRLAQIAPAPLACDKVGAGPCGTGNGPNGSGNGGSTGTPGGGGNAGSGGSGSGTGGPGGGAGGAGTSGGGAGNANTTGSAGGGARTTRVNPDTGQTETVGIGTAGSNSGGGGSGGDAQPQPTDLAAYRQQDMTSVLAPLAVLELLAILVLPPVLYHFGLRRRRKS